ncbi:hypothetical protein PR202_gb11780 [Eleusine coracana subsp. coracana]|uniref:Retrotransposon gag domain-containing protein n=1 Tax=Eleusine coracana subsp. coracana TaxID=191504 RepID=A0AAV5ENT8_ELECO|nr:hypothetical protein PR202_gb11780 [Eleusine coracana subsp. coracana]
MSSAAGIPSDDGGDRPWQSYHTAYTNAKAGMEGVDKENVQKVIYEMSKGSKYFENEQRKEALTKQKIEHLRAQCAKLTDNDISHFKKGQDLWEVVAGTMTNPVMKEGSLRKWRIKASKAMFVLKTTIKEDLVEHIRDAKTPKEAWETLAKLFCKKNEARLQLLENELTGISQGTLSISQYFTKVKNICREISQLDP